MDASEDVAGGLEEEDKDGEGGDEDERGRDDVARREAMVGALEANAEEEPGAAEANEDIKRVGACAERREGEGPRPTERVGDGHVAEPLAGDDLRKSIK